MANFGFSPEEYKDPANNFDPVPADTYFLKCILADGKDTRSGGEMIAARFQITRGEYENRLIFVNFNVVNANQDAQRMGRELLSNWSRACGKPQAHDTDQLLEIEIRAKVGIQPPKDGYGAQNRIFEFVPRDGDFEDTKPADTKPADTKKPDTAASAKINDPAKQGPTTSSKPAVNAAASGAKKNPWDD